MTIALRAAGAWASGSTSVTPALPAGNAAGDRNILRVCCKPFSATINTPSGWTKIAAASGTNGSTGSGIDTGSVQWAVFYRDWQSGDAAPTVSVTSGNVTLAEIKGYSKAADEDWDLPVGCNGSDTSSGTGFSLTMDANPGIVANDMLDTTAVIAGDNATFGTPTLTATGATIGTVTESPATEGTTTTGNDLEASASHALCTAGSASAAPVVGWTLSAAQTGGGALVRLRVFKALAGSAGSQGTAAGDVAHGVPMGGAAAAAGAATGEVGLAQSLAGGATGSGSAAGAASVAKPLAGDAAGAGAASGPLNVATLTVDSVRVDTASLIVGAVVCGDRGHGVLGSQIPATGENGASFLYNDLSLPADADKEIRGLITRWPAAGVLYVYEDGSFTYTGPSTDFEYQLYVDGVAVGAPQTVTLSMAVALAGDAAVQAAAAAALTVANVMAGSAQGQGLALGTLSQAVQLAVAAAGQGSATGTLALHIPMAGAAAGSASAAAGLSLSVPLAGAAAGAGLGAGTLASSGASLAGAAAAQGLANAALNLQVALLGAAVGIGGATGALLASGTLSGAAVAVGAATGQLALSIGLAGSALAVAAAQGALTLAIGLNGSAAAQAGAVGTLQLIVPLAGAAAALASASGGLVVTSGLAGDAVGRALAGGGLQLQVVLSGAAGGQAIVTGLLTATPAGAPPTWANTGSVRIGRATGTAAAARIGAAQAQASRRVGPRSQQR